jgi:hypothetical protein
MFAHDAQVKVFTGPNATTMTVPVVRNPTLYPDTVPFHDRPAGTAQKPFEGSVTTGAAGAGERTPATSGFLEFSVPATADNAKAVIRATASLPADLDLYLQKKEADGSWSGDIASGTSAELTGETMTTNRLTEGTYRIEVHNWAGPPGNEVPVKATFYNSADEPGT